MKLTRNLILGILFISFLGSSPAAVDLVNNSMTNYIIVIDKNADISTQAAAIDMAQILQQMTGALFPVVTDAHPYGDHELILGSKNSHLKYLDPDPADFDLKYGEYIIRTIEDKLIILGGPERGTINGMYGFLRDHLGCRWLTPGCQYIPSRVNITLGDINDRVNPAFRFRATCSAMQWDANWSVRNRLSESKATVGGPRPSAIMLLESDVRTATMANSWNSHALQDVPESLYKNNPQWRAETDRKRPYIENPVQRAFCFSDNSFAKWVAGWTKERLKHREARRFISITHADNSNYCQCKSCRKCYDKIGISGLNILFANKIAEEVAVDYPDTSLITFAYHSTFAPSTVDAHPNVRVIWAPIHADYAHNLNEGLYNQQQDYVEQLKEWLGHTTELGVWYYQFSFDTPLPRPCLKVTQENLQLLHHLGIDQMYIEMYFNLSQKETKGTDGDKDVPAYVSAYDYYTRKDDYGTMVFPLGLEHLRGYMYSQLLWNPDIDLEKNIQEFCEIYYGSAGEEMAHYILLTESLSSYDKTRDPRFIELDGVYMPYPTAPRMKLDVLEEIEQLFDRALTKTSIKSPFKRRVEMARMSPDWAFIVYGPQAHPARQAAFERFFGLMEEIEFSGLLKIEGLPMQKVLGLKKYFAKTLHDKALKKDEVPVQ